MIRSPAGYGGEIRIKRYQDYYQASYGVMMLSAGQAFSPIDLFASGAPGVFYENTFDTLFQDAAGTTPVTAVEQPVGLRLDKSRGLVLGSELVSNGDFSNGTTGWASGSGNTSIAVVSGELRSTTTGSSSAFLYGGAALSTVAGKFYKVTFDVYSSNVTSLMRCSLSGEAVTNQYAFTFSLSSTKTRVSGIVQGGGGDKYLFITSNTAQAAGSVIYFDNISVKELPGSHAFQTTDINRPVLSARYNLLTRTEEFDNAAWTKDNLTVSANTTATTDPLGGNTADRLVETAVNSNHSVSQGFVAAGTYRWSAAVKAAERTWCALTTYDGSVDVRRTFFDLSNGTIGTTATGHTASISDLGNGWYRVAIVYTATATNNYFYVNTATGNGGNSYLGDITKGIYIWGADLRVSNDGVGLPAYQRVTTATDYDTTGFPLYLRYNGTNSAMQTASIDFSSTDKMSVFAGVRKLSDAAVGVFAELSAIATNNGTFLLSAPPAAFPSYSMFLNGNGGGGYYQPTPFAAPITNTLSAQFDIGASTLATEIVARVNSTIYTTGSGGTVGTGNFGNYPLYLGARGGSSLWFNGRDYGLVVLGRTATATEIASTEAWLNARTRAYA